MKIPDTVEVVTQDKQTKGQWQTLRRVWELMASVVNHRLGFGDGLLADNIDGVWVNVVTPVAINTNFVVTHNLGRIPVGWIVMQKNAACDLYLGSIAATTTQLTLKATVGSVAVRMFIL